MRRGIVLTGLGVLAVGAADPQAGPVTGTTTFGVRPIEGAVVYLVPVSSDSGGADTGSAVIDQRKLRFVPRVLVVGPGDEVAFRNSDPLLHNIFGSDPDESFDLGTYPEGESRSHRFVRPGPHLILCNIHPEMEAWVFVAPTRWRTVSGADGAFRIDDVPPGRYRVRVWHRRAASWDAALTVEPGGAGPVMVDLAPERAGG